MNNYRKVFKKRHILLVVIHIDSVRQILENVEIAFSEGADGIFLIDHLGPTYGPKRLKEAYGLVREKYQNEWIGLNWLGVSGEGAIDLTIQSMDGLWIDDAGIRADHPNKGVAARELSEHHRKREQEIGKEFLLFGGVAFKYQQKVHDLTKAVELAIPYMDVITTSGDRTGYPPSIEKIKTMNEAINTHPLAIASGMTPENVQPYMRFTDCFSVATGISKSFHQLDHKKVRKMVSTLQ